MMSHENSINRKQTKDKAAIREFLISLENTTSRGGSKLADAKKRVEQKEGISLKEKRKLHVEMLRKEPHVTHEIDAITRDSKLLDLKDCNTTARYTTRVILPKNEEEFKSGKGDECYVVVTAAVKSFVDGHDEGGIYIALLNNEPASEHWFHLEFGDPILFTLRGKSIPVAFLDQKEALHTFLKQRQVKETTPKRDQKRKRPTTRDESSDGDEDDTCKKKRKR